MLACFVLADDFYIAHAMTKLCSKLHLTNYFYKTQSFIKCSQTISYHLQARYYISL